MKQSVDFRRNIFLHYLNLEYRKTINIDKFLQKKELINYIKKINYFSILFCKDYCLFPYSALSEDVDNLISNNFIKNNYNIFYQKGLIRASIREDSPEEFIDKKTIQYDSDSELYGYFNPNILAKLKQHNIPLLKRETEIGKTIKKRWQDELEDYANGTIWCSTLKAGADKNLAKKLFEIPDIIQDKGKGMIWPLIKKLLNEKNSIKNSEVRKVLHRLYFSTYLDKDKMVVITELPFFDNNFGLDFYKGKNYSFKLFDSMLFRLGIDQELFCLKTSELLLVKETPEFYFIYNFYHSFFGAIETIEKAVESLNFIDHGLSFSKIKKNNENRIGIDKVLFTFIQFSNHLADFKYTFEFIHDKKETKQISVTNNFYKIMGDQYNINQVGAVGHNASSDNNTFNQLNNPLPGNTNFEQLAEELKELRQVLIDKASLPEHYSAIGEVVKAEEAANSKDGNKVINSLIAAGKWVLDAAKDITTDVLAEVIKKQVGG